MRNYDKKQAIQSIYWFNIEIFLFKKVQLFRHYSDLFFNHFVVYFIAGKSLHKFSYLGFAVWND